MKLGHSESLRGGERPTAGVSATFKAMVARWPWLWPALVLVVATGAAYWPAFSAGFIWDDDAYVTGDSLLWSPDGWSRIWFSAHSQSQYFPLVFSTLRVEYQLWGLNPVGYHVVNVCLHIVNSLLVWTLLRRLEMPGAWLAAGLFALHPVQVETVAWVTELKNTESSLFYLLTLLAWRAYCAGKGRWSYGVALASALLALFAKTTACTLPAAMLLVLWLGRQPIGWRRVLQVLPFLVMGVLMGLVSVWWERHLGGVNPRFHLLGGPLDRVLIAARALCFYAGKIFWPMDLTFSYPRWKIDPRDAGQYLWLAACLGAAVVLWWNRCKLGRGPAAAVMFFAAVLSPMLGFIPLYTFYFSFVADHYQYLACLGLMALTAGAGARFMESRPALKPIRGVVAAVLLAGLGVLTWRQCQIYQNLEVLWTDTLRKNPASWMAHTNLGRLQAQRGQFAQAETNYQAALALNADAEAIHYNYGNLLARTGRLDDAVTQFRAALQIAPELAETHNNLGGVLNLQHHTDAAIAEFQRAIAANPNYAEAYYNLGSILAARHQTAEAIAAFQHALRLEPDSDLIRRRLQALTGGAN
jgi:tetratricopeptide (TPR) repeat protein